MKKNVRYSAELDADGTFGVIKHVATPDGGGWFLSDEKKIRLGGGLGKWNAEYAAACLNYLNHEAASKGGDGFYDAESLDCLSERSVALSELAYNYVRDLLGAGWALHNAYKLECDFMIDMWLKGAGCRFGFLPVGSDREETFAALTGAVRKVTDAFSAKGGAQ